MSNSRRTGAAMVELAMFLPVYFIVIMATIETCRMVYLRQSLKIAAYECARVAIIPGMQDEDLETQCDAILQGRRIKDYRLSVEPNNFKAAIYGDVLTVSISAPAKDNSLVAPWFYKALTVTESVRVMVEHDEK